MSSIRLACGEFGPRGERPGPSAKAVCATTSPRRATQTRTMAFLRTGAGILWRVAERTRVKLPPAAGAAFQVYLNGVLQQPGRDFRRDGDELVFERRLRKEGRLGFWRWLSLFLGVAGTYRQNDSVDVVYDVGGQRVVATGLPFVRPDT